MDDTQKPEPSHDDKRDVPVPDAASEAVPSHPPPQPAPQSGTPSQSGPDAGDPTAPTMADLDEEVARAMSAMDPADLAELTGDVVPTDEAAPSGTELVGKVVGVSPDEIFLEFGPKSQGILPRTQLKDPDSITLGQSLGVMVDRFDKEAGLLILRLKGSVQRASWETLQRGMLVEGRVIGMIKGGLEVDLNGIRGFMPSSQVSASPMKDVSVLLNERIRCEVIEVDRRAKNVVLSRRRLIEREQASARRALIDELEVGQTRKGTVRNITDFGAFVDLGGIEGLIHIRDLSWATVDKVSDVLATDQEVEVRILKLNAKRDRISLGLKQTQPDPWVHVPERYPVGTQLKVRIVRIADFGSFAELEPGIEGLIPISEMAWTRVQTVRDVVSVGDMVDAVVIRFEPDKRRLALSMKQAQPDPWESVLDGFSEQSLATGRVTRVTDFGAFVEVAPGIEGLIHISELSDKRVKTTGDVVEVGQVVEARVLSIDQENRRIALSIKQVNAPQQASDAVPSADSESPVPAAPKKRKKPRRGGLSSHYDW